MLPFKETFLQLTLSKFYFFGSFIVGDYEHASLDL